MKIVIPVSQSDASRLPLLVDVLLHHGNLGNHSICLYPTAAVATAAEEAAARLRTVCYDVTVHTLANFEGGWPKAPNAHWASVATHLYHSLNQHPWLWLEVDAVPMDANWANKLQQEYNACGKPLLGPVRQTVYRRENGEVYHIEGDNMMLGVAVYPNWLLNVQELKPLMRDFIKLPDQSPDQPFDVYLRWVFSRLGWAHTDSVKHCWKSTAYTSCSPAIGGWKADSAVNSETDLLFFTNSDGFADFVNAKPMPLIIHGCKDDSLYNLILNPAKTPIAEAAIAPQVLAEDAPIAPITLTGFEPIVTIAPQQQLAERIIEVTKDVWTGDLVTITKTSLEASYGPPASTQMTQVNQASTAAQQQPLSRWLLGPVTPEEEAAWPCTKQQFEEWLGTHSKAVRLRAMLEQLGFDKMDTARRAIGHWGYEAPVPATFIRRKK